MGFTFLADFFFPMTFEGYGLHSLFPSVQSKTNDSSNLSIFGKFTWLLPTFSEMTFTLLHPALADVAFLPPREKENHFPLPLKKRDYARTTRIKAFVVFTGLVFWTRKVIAIIDSVVPFNLSPYLAFIKLTLWPKNPLCSLSHSLLKSSFIKYRLFHTSVK